MRVNVSRQSLKQPHTNHHGVPAVPLTQLDELRRSVLACLLWESSFYESGTTIADRIKHLVAQCQPHEVAELAIEAREKQRLRHVPMLLVRELARSAGRCPEGLIAATLARVIQRADELAEFLAMYWSDDKAKDARARSPLSKQVKKGLATAFGKFDEYQLAKYNRDGVVRLKDVLFMTHAKPADESQAALWKRLVEGALAPAGTWEERLSAGEDKRAVFEDLLSTGKLGYMALLRNLRTMQQVGVNEALVFKALQDGAAKSKALPFRFVAAARAVPAWEPHIDAAMQLAVSGLEKLPGRTAVLVDVSPSMNDPLSAKSDLRRKDAAGGLAILLRGICQDVRVFAFSNTVAEVPPRNGMALFDAISNAVDSNGTRLGAAVQWVAKAAPDVDRLIVFTDEESQDPVGAPHCMGYMVNVATSDKSVAHDSWTRINGFSEAVVQYIAALEAAQRVQAGAIAHDLEQRIKG